jgi:peptidoglycan-N-acetylglucosamine deacetylase
VLAKIFRVVVTVALALGLTVAAAPQGDGFLPRDQDSSGLPLRFAFMDSTFKGDQLALGRHIKDLDGLIGNWLLANPDGTLTEQQEADPDDNIDAVLRVARQGPLQVLAMVSDEDNEERGFARLSEPEIRSRLEREILSSVNKHGFDGVVINFSHPDGIDEPSMRTLITELRTQLMAARKTVAVFVPGDSTLDYKALASASDLIVVELFNENLLEPGPLASTTWSKRVAALRAADIPAKKLIFTLGSFGRDWIDKEDSQTISFNSMLVTAAAPGAEIQFDRPSGNPRLQFDDSEGQHHEIWFLDAVTILNQMRILTPLAPRGLALWESGLGSEDQSLWHLFQRHATSNIPNIASLEELRSDYFVNTIGKGEVYRFLSRPTPGRRSITTTATGDLEEQYLTLPRPWQIQAFGVLPGTIALTFDDGPDPDYTDRILDILNREGVKATFFVTGSQSLLHPSTIKRIIREGHELGNHSWTHPDLSKLPDSMVKVELNATQRLLQVLSGNSVRLLRPPYASDDMADTAEEAHVVELATSLGYFLIGANLNPEDWSRPPKEEIVRRVLDLAVDGAGSVIELHDAGGDRTNTVEALPELIDTLKAKGFRFVSLSELIGQEGTPTLPVLEDQRGWVDMARLGFNSISLGRGLLIAAVWTCILLTSLRFVILFVSALLEHYSKKIYSDQTPRVSVIIPAYNEEAVIVRVVASILQSDYRNLHEILVVDDGSSDNTASVVRAAFAHDPRVRVFTKPNAGKWAALNFGLRRIESEIAVMIDADTLLQADAIRLLARHFGDPTVGAVAGNAKVGNRAKLVSKLQALEYVTNQNVERAGLAKLNAITVVPGAIGAWRREAVLRAGGYSAATLAEDCDLTFCIHRAGYKIVHEMQAVAWTEAPESWRGFMRQRFRWIYGTLQAAYRHSDTIFQRRFGAFAYFSLPSILLFSILLPLVSPVMDLFLVVTVIGAIVDVLMHPTSYSLQSATWGVGLYLLVFWFDFLIALVAFSLEPNEDRRLLAYLPLQRCCYRQILYVVVLRALLCCVRGDAQGWNKLARVGSAVFGLRASASPLAPNIVRRQVDRGRQSGPVSRA